METPVDWTLPVGKRNLEALQAEWGQLPQYFSAPLRLLTEIAALFNAPKSLEGRQKCAQMQRWEPSRQTVRRLN